MRLNVENMKSWVCNLLKAILCGFNALVERVAGFIYKNAREIGPVVKVLYVVVMVAYIKCDAIDAFVITICLMCVAYAVKIAYQKLHNMNEDFIPKPRERFTKVNKRGMIEVDRSRWQELIQYVYELEEYIQEKP